MREHREEKLAKTYTLREHMSSKSTPWWAAHPRAPNTWKCPPPRDMLFELPLSLPHQPSAEFTQESLNVNRFWQSVSNR